MDISWKNKSIKLKKIFIGSLLRQLIVLFILIITSLVFLLDLFGPNKFIVHVTDGGAKGEFLDRFNTEIYYLSYDIYERTDYLAFVGSTEINKEAFPENNYISFLIIDNTTGKRYANNPKMLDDMLNPEKYIKENSYIFYKADNRNRFSPFIQEKGLKFAQDSVVANFIEYYWYDKNDKGAQWVYKTTMKPKYQAWAEIIFIITSCILLAFFIVYRIIVYRKQGLNEFKKELEDSNIYKAFLVIIKKIFSLVRFKRLILFALATFLFFIASLFSFDFIYYKVRGAAYLLYLIYVIAYLSVVIVYFTVKHTYFNRILKGAEQIAAGNFNLTLKEKGDRDLIRLAKSINSIKTGYETALEEHIKNERLKTELITNVSHDLKTPLTSIVTYVNLLQKEGISEEEATDYIKILENKAKKLKLLIEDLFEVSKINSGKISLELAEIDIVDLIYQVIGEHSNFNKEKNLKFIVNSSEESIFLSVDGKQISRAMGNLVSNVLKYSMDNTRVYIDIARKDGELVISFKNISAYEMNFSAEEIFERFKRGDSWRNSEIEGSGLGLAIAKSIVELHGGRMYIEKEGDLFKVFIVLKAL